MSVFNRFLIIISLCSSISFVYSASKEEINELTAAIAGSNFEILNKKLSSVYLSKLERQTLLDQAKHIAEEYQKNSFLSATSKKIVSGLGAIVSACMLVKKIDQFVDLSFRHDGAYSGRNGRTVVSGFDASGVPILTQRPPIPQAEIDRLSRALNWTGLQALFFLVSMAGLGFESLVGYYTVDTPGYILNYLRQKFSYDDHPFHA